MDWNALIRKHADVVAGLVVWFLAVRWVGTWMPEGWGILSLVIPGGLGVAAYLLVQKYFPESRG